MRPPSVDPAVSLQNVFVQYALPGERFVTFKEYAIRLAQRRVGRKSFTAVRDVSLEVRPGETFGLIGRNGAGKSTLLKVVARVLRPTAGRVVVRGSVAPLLEFGAGFHPELTGRENVYLNGALLGNSRRAMSEKFDRIVEFSGLWEFIDAPIRTYSSGMVARLGFAIASDIEPDVLIVDEALSVGDLGFQRKSVERLRSFRNQGTTILVVSHVLEMIRGLCDRAAWLERGELRTVGPVDEVIARYEASLERGGTVAG